MTYRSSLRPLLILSNFVCSTVVVIEMHIQEPGRFCFFIPGKGQWSGGGGGLNSMIIKKDYLE